MDFGAYMQFFPSIHGFFQEIPFPPFLFPWQKPSPGSGSDPDANSDPGRTRNPDGNVPNARRQT